MIKFLIIGQRKHAWGLLGPGNVLLQGQKQIFKKLVVLGAKKGKSIPPNPHYFRAFTLENF